MLELSVGVVVVSQSFPAESVGWETIKSFVGGNDGWKRVMVSWKGEIGRGRKGKGSCRMAELQRLQVRKEAERAGSKNIDETMES